MESPKKDGVMENRLVQKISVDLQSSMKSGNRERLEVLRMMKSQVLLVNARGDLPDPEVVKILTKYGKKLREAAEEARKVGREDAARQSERELTIVEEYVPKAASSEEMKHVVEATIKELAAAGMKDMGRVMKGVQAKLPTADGATLSQIVKTRLQA